MSNPILIDPLVFASEGQILEGCLTIQELDSRVWEVLSNTTGEVKYTLKGFIDALQRPSIAVSLQATVMVDCQRCLEPMPEKVEADTVLTFFMDENAIEQALETDEDLDALLVEGDLNVRALIEDEIIMGLPLSPKHEVCGTEYLERAKADKPNPFAVLAALKRSESE